MRFPSYTFHRHGPIKKSSFPDHKIYLKIQMILGCGKWFFPQHLCPDSFPFQFHPFVLCLLEHRSDLPVCLCSIASIRICGCFLFEPHRQKINRICMGIFSKS